MKNLVSPHHNLSIGGKTVQAKGTVFAVDDEIAKQLLESCKGIVFEVPVNEPEPLKAESKEEAESTINGV
jgi:hypothetical protein